MNRSKLSILVMLPLMIAACGGDSSGPGANTYNVAVQSGDAQFATPNALLFDPLQVVVTHPVTEAPAEGQTVTWTVVTGSGAIVTPSTSRTDENGVATTRVQLGSSVGEYVVEARTEKIVGSPARFRARVVLTPQITGIPASANVGDTITITGQNFSPQGDDNFIMFGGFRGKVVSATATQLRAVVPACLPARVVPVTASLGAVTSPAVNLEVRGGGTITSLELARGEVRTLTDPAELSCLRLPGGIPGYKVLLVPQNYSEVVGTTAALRLAGLSTSTNITSVTRFAPASRTTTDVATWFENRLREREQEFLQQLDAGAGLRPQPSTSAACPSSQSVGDQCSFQVINKEQQFVNVTGVLKAVSNRALIYQDAAAPANGLSDADFQALGRSFDDPIYAAVTGAFGNPSDLDNNGKIIILLTPIVNALTPRGSSGFVAGFFYGCDLVTRSVCSGSNGAEIFYTLVADPTGVHSDTRSVTAVTRALPPVLSHEFQHMIHFGVRRSTDALWLAEGLAHHAEDIVADVYAARGDATNAAQYRAQNITRARRYLADPEGTSLIAEHGTGTLEMRGAAWLFVKYLVGQHGAGILTTLTQSTESSVTNVTRATGKTWSALLASWAIALYADDFGELAGANVRPEYTYPNMNLRAFIGGGDTDYPLRPSTESFTDFVRTETLPASSQTYVTVQAGTNTQPFSLNLSGQFGGGFAVNAAPQLSILRIQ